MAYEGDDHSEYDEPDDESERDQKIDDAKEFLLWFFSKNPVGIFYLRQLEVLHEERFFHWITSKALHELADEGRIDSNLLVLKAEKLQGIVKSFGVLPYDDPADLTIRFYWAKSSTARYWKRKARRVASFVAAYSRSTLTRGLGPHAEMMMDAALSSVGFVRMAKDVKEWKDKAWTLTNSDLDRVYERDGVAYGAEIKNKLGYIEHKTLFQKMRIAEHLGLRPLFIVRMAPKNYVEEVRSRGGFTLIYKWQLYPFGFAGVAKKIRDALGLPVDSPAALADQTAKRFLTWHELQLRVSIIQAYLERSFKNHAVEHDSRRKVEHFKIKRFTINTVTLSSFPSLPKDPDLRKKAIAEFYEQRKRPHEPTRTVQAHQKFLAELSLDKLEQYLTDNDLAGFLKKATFVSLTAEGLKDLKRDSSRLEGDSN